MAEQNIEKQLVEAAPVPGNLEGKRCLMVLHRFWPFLGGSERQFLKWADELDKKGVKTDVFTTNVWDNDFFFFPGKKYIKESRASLGKNINIRRFKIFHFPNRNAVLQFLSKFPGRMIKFLIGNPYIFLPGYYLYMYMISILPGRRFDFVIAGVFPHYYLIYPAYFYAKMKKIPFILVPLVHFGEPNSEGNFDLFFNEKGKFLLKRCDYILTITDDEKAKLAASGINPVKIKVSGIGIEEGEEKPSKADNFRKKYNIDGPYVLQISTQTHDKGSHHTVEAMKILWRKGINITLVLIGQILDEFEVYMRAQESYVFENTVILNYASEEDKNNAIDGCKVFVMPSKSDSFGLVYIEAWLHKKPVIAAYCSGVMEVIDEGINGFLVPFGDYEMIAGYVYKLIKDRELAKKMGEEGYKKAQKNYLWEQRIRNFNKLMDSLKL